MLSTESLIFHIRPPQKTVHVDKDSLNILTQESLEKTAGVQRLEEAAAQLYKALQAGRDTGDLGMMLVLFCDIHSSFNGRHGCNDGNAERVQNLQQSIL